MKKVSALAVLDFDNIPAGLYAVDAILKKAPIALLRAGTVTRGRYLVLFGGSTGSVTESFEEALERTGSAIIDHALLPDIHPSLFDAVCGLKRTAPGSLLILETETAASIVRAVEAAVKGTPVELIEVRLSDAGLSGKGIALLSGTLHDVDAAADLAKRGTPSEAGAPHGLTYRVIAAPHDVLERDVTAATRFETAPLLELDGEAG